MTFLITTMSFFWKRSNLWLPNALTRISILTKRTISSYPTSILGRWLIEKDYKKVNRKFDLANEDHCGCCITEQPKLTEPKQEDDSYYLPFIL